MIENDTRRLSRLTAILTQLQTKRLLTAPELAEKFSVSVRTIYRDIRALEQSGVPIVTEEGKGYLLLEGYRLPPVTFTETEANALITAGQLVSKNKDGSFVKDYQEAIGKIRAVLQHAYKDNVSLLAERVLFSHNTEYDRTSSHLSTLQLALTRFNLIEIEYLAVDSVDTTTRTIEPFALISTQENWLLVAWCRLRKAYRTFRLDRIQHLTVLGERFEPHKITLKEYFKLSQDP